MKCSARIIETKQTHDGMLLAKVQFDKRLPPKGTVLSVKWGATRSLSQNALLWVYYNWLINEGGLKDQGHFSAQALHDNLKQHFLSEKTFDKGQFKDLEGASSATLNKMEFSDFFEAVDQFANDFFGVDTSVFWEEHKKNYSND